MKLHAAVEGAGRLLRLLASPGQHADFRHVPALAADLPATDLAADQGTSSARLRQHLAHPGCTLHILPRRDMLDPPA